MRSGLFLWSAGICAVFIVFVGAAVGGFKPLSPRAISPVLSLPLEDNTRLGRPHRQVPHPSVAASPATMSIDIFMAELNALRVLHDLPEVTYSEHLSKIAARHSEDMSASEFVSHQGSGGQGLAGRLAIGDYEAATATENICAGQLSEQEAMTAWVKSPIHFERLLLADITQVGLAMEENPSSRYRTFWTLVLASPEKT